jgi:hypothetical protein
LLYWVGKSKNIGFYEKLSYPLLVLSFCSLAQDWSAHYFQYTVKIPVTRITPLFNIHFLTSAFFIAALTFINVWHHKQKEGPFNVKDSFTQSIIKFCLPALLLVVVYFSFYIEIGNYWHQYYEDSVISIKAEGQSYFNQNKDNDLISFKNLWLINYTFLFVTLLAFTNIKRFKHTLFGFICLVLSVLVMLVFFTNGLLDLGHLKDNYINQSSAQYYNAGFFNIGIRYICIAFLALLLYSIYKNMKSDFLLKVDPNLGKYFELLLTVSMLIVASNELTTWIDVMRTSESSQLGLSLLWGTFSLALVSYGIWKNKKHLRIASMVLFTITLGKLFFIDLINLSTIAKTIVFVCLGILLLIISFLYNKYKHYITDDND